MITPTSSPEVRSSTQAPGPVARWTAPMTTPELSKTTAAFYLQAAIS
ncbi:MAG: hypothetical protein F2825_09825, partial [Actinobacteria bacterium]|nr:hypothetical protein [Actinomycetota bacterium]